MMITNIEYHCETEQCNARLFDILSDTGMIEIKCPKCKKNILVDIEDLYETTCLFQKLIKRKRTKKELSKLPDMG